MFSFAGWIYRDIAVVNYCGALFTKIVIKNTKKSVIS